MESLDEIVLPARDCTMVNPSNTWFIESDSGNYLYAYNHVEKNLHFIDFSDGSVASKVPLAYEGPNSVRGAMGFSLIGRDSIALTFVPPAIALINFKGEIIWKKEITDEYLDLTTLITTSYKPVLKIGNKLFGPQPFFMDHLGMAKSDILKQRLVFSLNFDSGEISWHDVFYNKNYWDQGKKPSDYSWDQRGKYIYIAPVYDHEVIIFDTHTMEVVDRKEVESQYIKNFRYANEILDLETSLKMRLSHDMYGPIIYDRYRDLFYRFFTPGYEPEDELSFEELRPLGWSRPYSGVMVLDSSLNVIGEHLFDKFEIHPASMFVGEKGLYLSMNNENHPEFDENHFRYKLVRFRIGD
jgi:hypothetical protein